MINRAIARKVQEHIDLTKVLNEAIIRRQKALCAEEWDDANTEVLNIQEEIAWTEIDISRIGSRIWS